MLTEPQVQRYSRQVLLGEVGGRGQARLLAHPFLVRGQGPAFDAAVAYLAAGGSPLDDPGPTPRGGFLGGSALGAFNPDAVPTEKARGLLASEDDPGWTGGPVVVLAEGHVAFRRAGACPACLAATTVLLPVEPGAPALVWGALAALVAQRLALGRAEAMGAITWGASGLRRADLARCPAHAGT